MSTPCSVSDLVAEARRQIREVDPRTFAEARSGAIVIDVRDPPNSRTSHIPDPSTSARRAGFQVDAHPPSRMSATPRCRTRSGRSSWSAAPAAAPRSRP